VAGGPPGSPDAEGDRYIEIWNHVFMQFDMQPDGSVKNLPAPCVDTGMGLERLAAVMQHVHSNYEIDLFQELIKAAARETYTKDLNNPSLKVIADHIRACAFLVSDGVIPGSEGRGYVQRRIIRRAIRHGYKLGQKTPFFHKLVPDLAKLMGAAYPSLAAKAAQISEVLKVEEVRFFETLENGMEILDASIDEMNNSGAKPASVVLPGDVAFRLHDTYGFPLDLTQDVCRERGVTVDEAGFNAAMDKQKAQARAAGKFKMDRVLEYLGAVNQFVGYERLEQQAKVVALYFEGAPVKELKSGQEGIVVLDDTPFYAESGGQVGDEGAIVASGVRFDVSDTLKVKADVHGMHGTLAQGTLRVGDVVKAQVDTERRTATMRNHSVTHIMHKALREVLGDHVQQKGSLVDAEKTRFDFSHNRPMTDDEIREVEARVNAEILQNLPTRARVLPIEEAKKTGAMMLFGEKYGDEVRVLDIGTSRELCGGTHVARTGDIGLFKVLAESGVAAGVRRLEATTGATALVMLNTQQQELREIAHKLNVPPMGGMVALAVTKLLDDKKLAEKELARLKSKVASSQGDDLVSQADDVGGVKVLAAALEGADVKTLRETLDKLKDMLKSAAIVLGTSEGGKVTLIAGVTADLTSKLKAGDLVNFVAQQVGGKGGGRPDMAQAGGTDPSKLPEALASVRGWVAQRQH
jgi:alanyl-tRNA synthetase